MLKKKILIIVSLMVLVSIVLSGCGGNSADSPNYYTLNINVIEGEGTILEDGKSYPAGTIVTLTVKKEGIEIKEVTGSDANAIINDNDTWKILMNSDKNINVSLGWKMYKLTTQSNFTSLGSVMTTVEEYPDGYTPDDNTEHGTYPYGTIIEADAFLWNEDARFVRWEDDAITYGDQNPIYIVMDKDKTITATFAIGHTTY